MIINTLNLLKREHSEKVMNCFCFNLTNGKKNVILNTEGKIKEMSNNFYSGYSENVGDFDVIITKNNKNVDVMFIDEDYSTLEVQKKIFENNVKNIVIFASKEGSIKVSNFLNKNMNFLNVIRLTNDDIINGLIDNIYIYNPKIIQFNSKIITQ